MDAISDKQGIPWMVVGPTSNAHFDKRRGQARTGPLVGTQVAHRRMEIDRHREWRDDLESLKHRLQQYQTEHPRGWFSDREQKLEVLASRWRRRPSRQIDSQRGRRSWKLRRKGYVGRSRRCPNPAAKRNEHQDRMEQFDRNFGSHLGDWRRHLELTRDRAKKSRLRQDALKQEASEDEDKAEQSDQASRSVRTVGLPIGNRAVPSKVLKIPARQPKAGATEVLRSCYQLLLADYEGKVNADSLSHRAAGNDEAAVREMREFQRVIQQFPDIRDDAVEADSESCRKGCRRRSSWNAPTRTMTRHGESWAHSPIVGMQSQVSTSPPGKSVTSLPGLARCRQSRRRIPRMATRHGRKPPAGKRSSRRSLRRLLTPRWWKSPMG